jgi:hypothetical protein
VPTKGFLRGFSQNGNQPDRRDRGISGRVAARIVILRSTLRDEGPAVLPGCSILEAVNEHGPDRVRDLPEAHEILRQSAIESDQKFWAGKLHLSVLQWIGIAILWGSGGFLAFAMTFDVSLPTNSMLERIMNASIKWIVAIAVVGGTILFIRWSMRKRG